MLSRAKYAFVAFGLAVSALFAYFAVRNVHPHLVWRTLREARLAWLVPAFLLLALTVLARSERWRALFVPERRPGSRPTLAATLVGYFFNTILPGRAGEAARVLDLTRRAGVSPIEAAGTVIVERIYDIVALLGLLFVFAPWYPALGWFRNAGSFALVLAAALVATVAVLVRFGDRSVRLLLRPLALLPFLSAERVGSAATRLNDGLAALRQPRLALAGMTWTIASWILLAGDAWLVLRCFDLGLSPVAGVLLVVVWNLSAVLPSSPAGVGVFEAAVVLALTAYHVPRSQALSVALVLHAVNQVPFLLAGPLVLAGRPWARAGPFAQPEEKQTEGA